jgi:DNA polymerase alpha subunit A
VALAMKAKGQSARVGDTVPYVICKDEDMAKSFALRAHHPDELRREDSTLEIDIDYYLNIQIHPPVARLCQPIEGTDSARIAECLGLDASKFRSAARSDRSEDQALGTFEFQISDQERFKDAERLQFSCTECGEQYQYDSITRKEVLHPSKRILNDIML